MSPDIEFDVALSFAGEDRAFVERVARHLQAAGVRVFYDDDQRVDLWGKNLIDYLDKVFRFRSQYVVMFVSQHYASKSWPNHERQSAMARALEEKYEYVLPARFDKTELSGLHPTISYVDLTIETEESFAKLILEKLARTGNLEEQDQTVSQEPIAEPIEEDITRYDRELEKFADAGAVLTSIRSAPHWEVIIRPIVYKTERINSLPNCFEMLSSCRVARRNWEFPYVRNANKSTGNDWLGGDIDAIGHRESWRLYQSGQFVFYKSFRESFLSEDIKKHANVQIHIPEGFTPAGYHEVIGMIYTVTEFFEFMANYIRHGIVDDGLVVGIFMRDVKDHILYVWASSRHWSGFYSTSDNDLGKFWRFPKTKLLDQAHPTALEVTNFFWQRFGWFDARLDLLAADQAFD